MLFTIVVRCIDDSKVKREAGWLLIRSVKFLFRKQKFLSHFSNVDGNLWEIIANDVMSPCRLVVICETIVHFRGQKYMVSRVWSMFHWSAGRGCLLRVFSYVETGTRTNRSSREISSICVTIPVATGSRSGTRHFTGATTVNQLPLLIAD